MPKASDLIVEMEDGYADDEHLAEELVVPSADRMERRLRGPSGCHRSEGVIMATEPDFNADAKIESSQILDITRTALCLMGVPIPTYIDRKVLVQAIRPRLLQKHPMRYEKREGEPYCQEPFSKEDAREIEDRLRALGHM